MNEAGEGISPETRALDALIDATIKRAEGEDTQPGADSMLFLGNRHVSFPTLVVQDPVLEPVDKLVWMAIMLKAKETGRVAAFPSYSALMQTANVSAKATIARAIAILRITRWLTLCGRMRERDGRFKGNVYVLHDEPLPLVDVMHLDVEHLKFLRESVDHYHARVRTVARAALDTIDEDIGAGRDVCADESVWDRRIQAAESVEGATPRRFFAFSARVMAELRSKNDNSHRPDHPVQNLKTVDGGVQNLNRQNLNSVCSSSNNIYKTTTTTTRSPGEKKFDVAGENDSPLIYPKRLVGNQRELANRYLASVPAASRQLILDELEGRFRSENLGMPPLYDEVRFLFSLCKALKKGAFKANLGIKVAEERLAREKAHRKRMARAAKTPAADDALMRQRREAAQGKLAEMRKAIGLPAQPANTDNADDAP